jgi:hypothetical protein
VKCWKTWTVDSESDIASLEESVYLVRAESSAEARELATSRAREQDSEFVNELGQEVKIRFEEVSSVYDTMENRIHSGLEVFAQLYEYEGHPESVDWLPSFLEYD